jgi:pantothenate kinase
VSRLLCAKRGLNRLFCEKSALLRQTEPGGGGFRFYYTLYTLLQIKLLRLMPGGLLYMNDNIELGEQP